MTPDYTMTLAEDVPLSGILDGSEQAIGSVVRHDPGLFSRGDLKLVLRFRDCESSTGTVAVVVQIASDSVDTLSSPTSHATVYSGVFDSLSGQEFVLPLPNDEAEDYFGLTIQVAGGDLTGGSFDAFISAGAPGWRAYANGV